MWIDSAKSVSNDMIVVHMPIKSKQVYNVMVSWHHVGKDSLLALWLNETRKRS